jgi:arginyl-tRNA synthetase
MMASKTTENAKVLKRSDGRTTSYMLKDIGSREWLKNM